MATFLALCQQVAQESGTISGVQPSSVTGQTGRLAKVVEWVKQAWVEIQASRNDWQWMRQSFTGTIAAGTSSYTATDWLLTDHDRWVGDAGSVTVYPTADGAAGEYEVQQIAWMDWRRLYDRGVPATGSPAGWAISPAGAFVIGPVPDVAYTLRGEYWQTPQVFAANTDTPRGLPSHLHQIIKWRALMFLHAHDEADQGYAAARAAYTSLILPLERDQLPPVSIRGSMVP